MNPLSLLALGAFTSASLALHAAPPPAEVAQFFQQHCVKCHGEKKQKAGVRLDTLAADFANRANRESWLNILDALHAGDMPPEDEPRPDVKRLGSATDWIIAQVRTVEQPILAEPTTPKRADKKATLTLVAPVPVNPSGQLPDGAQFATPEEFKQLLLARQDRFLHALTEKLFIYALGREAGFRDRETLHDIQARIAKHQTLSALISDIVCSNAFHTK